METEAKFIVPDEATFGALRDIEQIGPYTRRDTRTKQVHDRYVDTEDRSFFRHRLFARLRQGSGGDLLLTLKGLGSGVDGAIHSREEFESPVQGLDVAGMPEGDVRKMVEQVAGDKPLVDLFALDQTRLVSNLYQGDRQVAEMSLDEVTIGSPQGQVHDYELEIELRPEGLVSDLRIMSRLLAEAYNLAPQPQSKFERAMTLTHTDLGQQDAAQPGKQPSHEETSSEETATPHPNTEANAEARGSDNAGEPTIRLNPPPDHARKKSVTGLLPTDSAPLATRKIIGVQFKEMLRKEKGTRKGEDPEALHDMRVATRRMRAVFRVMGKHVAGPPVDGLQKGLRDLAHAEGAVRDLDVLIAHAERFRDGLPEAQRADMAGLIAEWCGMRDRERKRLLALLDSKEYARLTKGLEKFLSSDEGNDMHPGSSPDVQPYHVRHIAGSAIWDRYEAVRAFEVVMDAPALDQLHALRIAGKYLRYALECFSDVLPSDAERLIKDIAGMQDQIGQLHDAQVAAGLIRDFMSGQADASKKDKKGGKADKGDKGDKGGKQAKGNKAEEATGENGLTAYLQDREAAMRRIQDEFGPTWSVLSSPEWRGRLARVVAGV